MRSWFAIVALAIGLALALMPVGHALAPQSSHATHTLPDQHAEKATPAAVAVCCPVPDLPAVSALEHPTSFASVAWSKPAVIAHDGQLLTPEPPPPRL